MLPPIVDVSKQRSPETSHISTLCYPFGRGVKQERSQPPS